MKSVWDKKLQRTKQSVFYAFEHFVSRYENRMFRIVFQRLEQSVSPLKTDIRLRSNKIRLIIQNK